MNLVVDTVAGPVEGREKDGVLLFCGIPYAMPPVASLRFKAPRPPSPWQAVRDAKRFSPAAPQVPSGGMTDNVPVNWDEDCLYLNVSTPGLDRTGRAVLVWIHGGGYRTGQGAIPWYSGASFARLGDIVTVSINYRLGALGFTDLSRFGDDFATSGANGTMDQLLALQWVRDNIERFGGDPDKVTVAGESAGAFSVGTLLASPAADDLFRGAILQSGALHHTLTRTAGQQVADLFLEEMASAGIADLLSASAEEILAAQARVDQRFAEPSLRASLGHVSPFYPVQGNMAVPGDPLTAVRGGQGANVKVLAGTNKDEATLFVMSKVSAERVDKEAERLGNRQLPAVYRSRQPDATPTELYTAMSTDNMFRIPCLRLAEARLGHDPAASKTWMYQFTWESRSRLKSTHALEIPFAFNNLDKPGVGVFLGKGPLPQSVADVMHHAWIGFIKDGDPGWKAYDLNSRTNMRFDEHSGPVDDPDAGIRQAWQGIR